VSKELPELLLRGSQQGIYPVCPAGMATTSGEELKPLHQFFRPDTLCTGRHKGARPQGLTSLTIGMERIDFMPLARQSWRSFSASGGKSATVFMTTGFPSMNCLMYRAFVPSTGIQGLVRRLLDDIHKRVQAESISEITLCLHRSASKTQ